MQMTRSRQRMTAAVSAAQIVMPSFPSAGLAQPGVYSSNIRIPMDNEHENHFRLRATRGRPKVGLGLLDKLDRSLGRRPARKKATG